MGKLARERKALAAAVIGFYMSIYFLVSLQAPAGWGAAFGGLAGVYAAAFFGLVTGYFWARWFALGLGISGLISAGMSIWQIGPEPVLVFYGVTHALISIALWGGSVAAASRPCSTARPPGASAFTSMKTRPTAWARALFASA
jgi:hypothetical protein